MRGLSIAQGIAAVLMSGLLAACGGGSIGNGSTGSTSSSSSSSGSGSTTSSGSSSGSSGTTTTQTPTHLILVPSSSTLSSNAAAGTAGSAVTLTATLTDQNNVVIANFPISFVASAGVLVPGATETDVNGNEIATLSAGNATSGTTINATATAGTLSATTTVVVASTTPSYALGTLSSTGTFTPNVIAIGQTPLAAGGSSGLQVSIVDTANGNTPFSGSATVSFSSPCQSQSLANIASPITSTTGTFSTTYNATGCSGSDTITATALINSSSLSAAGTITVQPPTLGGIVFVSATPTSIGLKGTGLVDTSTIVFQVVDSNGNPVTGQQVDFSLTTTAGGVSVSPANAKSNSSGQVQTTVQSGSVHTTVRVTAVIDGTALSTESSLLTISTGVPTQNGISLAATILNLIGDNFDGKTTTITARLADRYANPVPDGTSVAFTTECGSIQPSCTTVGGACSVVFTTQNPRTRDLSFPASGSSPASATYLDNGCAATTALPNANNSDLGCDDHRCTVTAYAIGEESFTDCNGTGFYISKQAAGNNASQCPNGDFFVSLPEVFFDYNESGVFNGDFESFVDFNGNGKYDAASGLFVGLLCNDPECDPNQSELNVSQDLVIVMSNSNLFVFVNNSPPPAKDPHSYVAPPSVSGLTIPLGATETIYVSIGDTALQAPAAGTVISASMNNGGTILAPTSNTVLNVDDFGYVTYSFTIQAPTSSTSGTDTLLINATTPAFGSNAGQISTASIPVQYR